VDRAEGRRGGSQAAGHVRTEDSFPDDLTAIRGIGMASQNRLYKAGIKTYAALASAEPAEVRRMLGNLANDRDN
jgi:predicted flap endonuclease-1-like 5' DNA nuclease